jgi:hypothetical protein
VADLAPTGPWWVLALYLLGALHLAFFFAFFVLFRRAEARARAEGGALVLRYNRMLRGFPNSFYAKMLGKRPLEAVSFRAEAPKGPQA